MSNDVNPYAGKKTTPPAMITLTRPRVYLLMKKNERCQDRHLYNGGKMEYSDLYVQRIKSLCKKRRISVNKLSNMAGIHQSTLDNIVRGLTKNPKARTLHKIALAFSMTLSEFLDFPELNNYSFDENEEEF